MEDLREILKSHKLHITPIRITLLDILKQAEAPLSVEAIETLCKNRKQKANTSSIYRQLESLSGLGILEKIDAGTNRAYFEWNTRLHHHHFWCRKCKKIECMPGVPCQNFLTHVPQEFFREKIIEMHHLSFSGICKHCTT